jgi:hypothetical protein
MATPSNTNDPLRSWNDTAARRAIVGFVETVTSRDGPGYLPSEERVAVFDNDGTLWCEKPMPIELGFVLQHYAPRLEGGATVGSDGWFADAGSAERPGQRPNPT